MATKAKVVQMAAPAPRVQLTVKYNPKKLAEFIGFDPIRAILQGFARDPYPSAWFLLGPSGLGKTTMALALRDEMKGGGMLHHVASRECNLERVEKLIHTCSHFPMQGKWNVVLVDEADQMSQPAQHAFLSVLDGTHHPEHAVFIFTANDTKNLEARFLSRCKTLRFDLNTVRPIIAAYLERIWKAEGGKPNQRPDCAELFRKSSDNIRTAIQNLELLLMDPTLEIPDPLPVAAPAIAGGSVQGTKNKQVDPARRAAALKAWDTMRRNRGEIK